ncbi:MAG: L,D-transpeptidase family protein [Solidesulfovibrio sp. DCME]|uniref:L,D-transpeptidase family protein n=1 Tax=Solidesulfovibrio sp. DCME TaxID=3447380 RepID=UPI003D0FAA5B
MKHHTALPLLIFLVMGLGLGCQATQKAKAQTGPALEQTSPLAGASQIVLVVAENWNTNQARLRRFERSEPNGIWHPVGEDVPVNLGRNGLAWGRGLHGERLSAAPVKAEGDGRAPAGVFSLPRAFIGPSESVGPSPKFPVYQVTPQTVCVDTDTSKYYNQTFEENKVTKDWNSEERMLRPDGLYRFGLFVDHNAPNAQPGAGSCIFMHLWRGPGSPTAGCTAMAEPGLLVILGWLDATKRPVLVQLPREELVRLAPVWGAPELAAK